MYSGFLPLLYTLPLPPLRFHSPHNRQDNYSAYTRLVLFNTWLLSAPNPRLNNTPPMRHPMTLPIPALSGVSIGIIIKNSIPVQKEPVIASHVFCFAIKPMNR